VPPIAGELREGCIVAVELLFDLITQKPAQTRRSVGELLCRARRDGMPAEERLEEQLERRWCVERASGIFDAADQPDNCVDELTASPEAELIPIRIDQVRKRL
jgi:hypothetical protein